MNTLLIVYCCLLIVALFVVTACLFYRMGYQRGYLDKSPHLYCDSSYSLSPSLRKLVEEGKTLVEIEEQYKVLHATLVRDAIADAITLELLRSRMPFKEAQHTKSPKE